MSKKHFQFPVAFTPFLTNGISDMAEKLGVSRASFIRMCVKKELDERGYKKTEKYEGK